MRIVPSFLKDISRIPSTERNDRSSLPVILATPLSSHLPRGVHAALAPDGGGSRSRPALAVGDIGRRARGSGRVAAQPRSRRHAHDRARHHRGFAGDFPRNPHPSPGRWHFSFFHPNVNYLTHLDRFIELFCQVWADRPSIWGNVVSICLNRLRRSQRAASSTLSRYGNGAQ
jgi:hypothetical protein